MNNIILIGFMGCGKSSIGRKLSYKVQMTFFDTDKQIEKEQERSITDIFETSGEGYFRQLETQCLQELLKEQVSQVIAVGGGMPLKAENCDLLHRLGTVVYLRAAADTIYERLKNDTTRPLLQGKDSQKRISELMEQRRAVYEGNADCIVDVDDKEFEEVLNEVQEVISAYEAVGDKWSES